MIVISILYFNSYCSYKCMATKLLSTTSTTDYLFPSRLFNNYITTSLMSQCDPEYDDEAIIALCEGDINELDIDSAVPVSDPLTNKHYMNKYCAYCNGVVETSYLKRWQLLIYSNQYISKTINNIMSTIIETRGNIFFHPPEFVKVRRCFSSYTIGKCNVTGAWDHYEKGFETACDIYLDPYIDPDGTSYKNYFCYSCNKAKLSRVVDVTDVYCPLIGNEEIVPFVQPAFSTIFGPSGFDRSDTQDSLNCTSRQVEDNKLVSCFFLKVIVDCKLDRIELIALLLSTHLSLM